MDLKAVMLNGLRSAVAGLRKFAYSCPLPAPSPMRTVKPRLGLALGGGFARGLAHIGVLKVLVENRIPIDAIAGVSVGGIIGAGFASGLSPQEMIELARKTRWSSFARWTVARLGLATNQPMEAWLRGVLKRSRFEDLSIPLAIVAADIATGEAVTFREGDLVPPLRASCSVPGFFTPVAYQGRLLVDGAIVGSVPTVALREAAVDVIIGVSLRANDSSHVPINLFQVVGQAFQIAQSQGAPTWGEYCHLVIQPDVGDFHWDDFDRVDELIWAGEHAARQALPGLRVLMQPRAIPESQPTYARAAYVK